MSFFSTIYVKILDIERRRGMDTNILWNNFLEILIYRAGIRIIIYQNKRIRISRM